MGLTASAAADARLNQRVSFDVIFAAIFLTVLHGFSVFKIMAILYANYYIATKLPRQYVPAASWTFAVGTLFANEFTTGYSYGTLFSMFLPSIVSEKGESARNLGHVLDSYGGLMSRWEVLFKFTILRLISFNLDYYWAHTQQHSSSSLEVISNPPQHPVQANNTPEETTRRLQPLRTRPRHHPRQTNRLHFPQLLRLHHVLAPLPRRPHCNLQRLD